jgi:sugar/nucleoside kinase (ribokinase family)
MGERCIVVGDVMMDVTALIESEIVYASDTPARVSLQPGGSAANTAAWIGAGGGPVTFVGCVGDDPFGIAIRAELTALHVDHHLHVSRGLPTGTCIVIVDHRRERTMFPDSGANSDLPVEAFDGDLITAGAHVHLTGYTLINPASRPAGLAALARARDVGATCSIDPSSVGPLRRNLDLFRGLLPRIDGILANAEEAMLLTGAPDAFAALDRLARIVPLVVVKRGEQGALAAQAGRRIDAPAPAADVVDSTGAGDAFAAGFLPAWLAGDGLDESVAAGQAVAALAVGRVGASPMVR